MKPKFSFVDIELEAIKHRHLHRKLFYGTSNKGKIKIQDKILINLSSNDYLGMPISKIKIRQMQSSSRLVSGNDESFNILEKKLAKHKSQQASLIFPTGYMANLGLISTIVKKGDLILSDELNHVSIIEACKLSGAKTVIYKHNDMDDLFKKIKTYPKNKFLITEGVFSMDGDICKLKEISEIATKSNIVTMLDDAHGDFVLGRDGRGTANHLGLSKKIDVYISSLSKGLGSFGGYFASRKNVIDFCINKSRSFIYTSALPSFLVDYSLKRFQSNREKHRKKLQNNVKLFIKKLKEIGFEINSKSHIIPIMIRNEKTSMEFGKFLFQNGIYAQPIRYPTVPKNLARIRISVTAWLSQKDIEDSIAIFEKAYSKYLK